MFDLFKIKKYKKMTEELQQENANLLAALTRANEANRELSTAFGKIKNELELAVARVRELDGQIRMKDLQKQASERYSDDSRNY